MESNLYFLSNGKAVMISEHSYAHEDDLQAIIAENPTLLLRSAELEDNSLFLVKRELSISEGTDSSNSYSLDVLLVDQAGIPVLVEVKRSSDTRIRREVVAQMLDYACRASDWDIGVLRESFRSNNAGVVLQAYDTDVFWESVSNNLRSEVLRLVFAADRIPETLKQLIDFLDRSMPNIEVYGTEIRQFVANNVTLLSSSFVGGSVELNQSGAHVLEWDADSFAQCLLSKGSQQALTIANDLRDYLVETGFECAFSHGTKFPSFSAKYKEATLFKVVSWSNKRYGLRVLVEIYLPALLNRLGDGWSDVRLRHLLSNISPIEPWEISGRGRYLYIDLELFGNEDNMTSFRSFIDQISGAIMDRNSL